MNSEVNDTDPPIDGEPDPTVLAVIDVGTTVDVDGVRWPTAVVDASRYPAITDLARVHATDGVGDISTDAMCLEHDDGHVFLLGVRLTSPVVCTFALAFSFPVHRPFIEDAAKAEQLVIATTPPDGAADEQPLWLALDLDTDRLTAALP